MEILSANIKHTEKTYRTLCRVRYNLYHKEQEIKLSLVGACIILISLFIKQTTISLIILFVGCWVLVSAQTPPMRMAKMMIDQIKGNFPVTSYLFSEDGIVATNQFGSSSAEYSQIQYLVRATNYFYIFFHNESAFMIDLDELSCDSSAFSDFMERKTNIGVIEISNLSSWNYVLKNLLHRDSNYEPPHL